MAAFIPVFAGVNPVSCDSGIREEGRAPFPTSGATGMSVFGVRVQSLQRLQRKCFDPAQAVCTLVVVTPPQRYERLDWSAPFADNLAN